MNRPRKTTVSCEVIGCTYASANNYNEAATDDDGTCEFDLTGSDCPGEH